MTKQAQPDQKPKTLLRSIREWLLDALLMAFLLAMLIRTFVAEPFRIPSSSMTPTLIGTDKTIEGNRYRQMIKFYDVDDDGQDDMILNDQGTFRIYKKEGNAYHYAGDQNPGPDYDLWTDRQFTRQDLIIVAKFMYWFRPPSRGDIVVFKVPPILYEDPEKAVYIKRVVGLPGEELTLEPTEGVPGHMDTMNRLVINGERVESPSFFKKHKYENPFGTRSPDTFPPYAEYEDTGYGMYRLTKAKVPDNMVYVFGDNTVASLDSRYWGGVPLNHLRGRALMRFFFNAKPKIKFLE